MNGCRHLVRHGRAGVLCAIIDMVIGDVESRTRRQQGRPGPVTTELDRVFQGTCSVSGERLVRGGRRGEGRCHGTPGRYSRYSKYSRYPG